MIKVRRSSPAPESLSAKKSYKGSDVRERLQEDFFGKCYLCERDVGPDFQVEHFQPKHGYPELVYVWENLFPACSCNQRRLKWHGRSETDKDGEETGFPKGGMLNPAEDDIEDRLDQSLHLGCSPKETFVNFKAKDTEDTAAANTAEELDRLHNRGETGHVRRLREEIKHHVAFILQLMADYFEAIIARDQERKTDLQRDISRGLLPNAPFAGVVRGTLRKKYRPSILEAMGL